MKRAGIILLALMINLLLICGCKGEDTKSGEDVTEQIRQSESYSVLVKMIVKEKEFRYVVTKEPDSVKVEVVYPTNLQNFTVTLTGTEYSVAYYDIAFVTDELPDTLKTAIGPVFDFLDAMGSSAGQTQVKKGKEITVTYEIDGKTIECVFDSESKLPKSLVYNGDTTIEFLEFTF